MPITATELQHLAIDAVARLNVGDAVHVVGTRGPDPYGHWFLTFADGSPRAPHPTFEIGGQARWEPDEAARELRSDLRKKLHICPLCQRRAHVESVPDRDAVAIECDTCQTFQISGPLIHHLRNGYDAGNAAVSARLPRLSAYVQRVGDAPLLTLENWMGAADAAE